MEQTPFDSVAIFTRDYSGRYTFDIGNIWDIKYVRHLVRLGNNIRFGIENAEVYSADIVYFRNDIDTMYALVRRYAVADATNNTLYFAHILYTIDTTDSTYSV